MRTGYFGNRTTGRVTKVHIVQEDANTPICGARIADGMSYQMCAADVVFSYVECERCRGKYVEMQSVGVQRRMFGEPDEIVKPSPKARAFFFHYNKPASQKAKRPQISVHWSGTCFIVDNIECYVPCKGRVRKRQPYFVMAGRGIVTVSGLGKGSKAGITG